MTKNQSIIAVLLAVLFCTPLACEAKPTKKVAATKKNPGIGAELLVKMEQTGGLMATHKIAETSTCYHTGAEQKVLRDLVKNSGIAKDSPITKLNKQAADVFYYDLTVTENKKTYTAKFDDTTLPDSYRPLVQYMQKLAKDVKQK